MKGKPVVQDDKISFELELSGTNISDWVDGTKATNKQFAFTGTSMFSVKNSKRLPVKAIITTRLASTSNQS